MKKRIVSLFLAALMLLGTLSFVSCGDTEVKPEAGTVTRMTVDVNPSVEFMVDDRNKIVSVTALNDDGSILIVGESFIGKTPEEAVELTLSLCADMGYLVSGNAAEGENEVKISVSGDSEYAKALIADVRKKAQDTLASLDVKGVVERVDALTVEALRALALGTSLYTEEEIKEMNENQLCAVIKESRVETALLLTEEMRNAYYSAKEYEIDFAESEATAKIIEGLGGIHMMAHTLYKTALDLYEASITELDNLRYELLVSPASEYQKSLTKLREAKVELLKQKNYTASLEINGEEYKSATVTLQLSEENYEKALAAYEALGEQANAALETLIVALEEAKTKLDELEDTLFDENIKEKLAASAADIEKDINAAKDGFFESFETAHKDDIEALEATLLEKKNELKATAEGE